MFLEGADRYVLAESFLEEVHVPTLHVVVPESLLITEAHPPTVVHTETSPQPVAIIEEPTVDPSLTELEMRKPTPTPVPVSVAVQPPQVIESAPQPQLIQTPTPTVLPQPLPSQPPQTVAPQPFPSQYPQQTYHQGSHVMNTQHYTPQTTQNFYPSQPTPAIHHSSTTPTAQNTPITPPPHNIGPQLNLNPRITTHIDKTTPTMLVTKAQNPIPKTGYQKYVAKIAPFMNIKKSTAEINYDSICDLINADLRHPSNITNITLKGGSGNTVSTVMLGSTLKKYRNQDQGTIGVELTRFGNLATRMTDTPPNGTMEDIANYWQPNPVNPNISEPISSGHITTSACRNDANFYALTGSKNPILTSHTDGHIYNLDRHLHTYYRLVLWDAPTALDTPYLTALMNITHGLVVNVTANIDAINQGVFFLQEILPKNFDPSLISKTVVLIHETVPITPSCDIPYVVGNFTDKLKVAGVYYIPFDEHIALGSKILYEDRVSKPVKYQYMKAAAKLISVLR